MKRGLALLLCAAAGLAVASAVSRAAPATLRAGTDTTSTSGAVSLRLVRPLGPIVTKQRFAIVLHSDTPDAGAVRLDCTCGHFFRPQTSAEGATGDYRFALATPRYGGTYAFSATLVGQDTPLLNFTLGVEPPPTAIQALEHGLVAPGCTVCVIRDRSGDDRGGSPDIASASSTYAHGSVTFRIVTYGSVRSGYPPCVTGWIVKGPHASSYNVCALPRFAQLPAHVSYPNDNTIVYRVRAAAFRSPKQFTWQVWVLYPGDTLKDTVPDVVHLGNDPRNCSVVVQLRTGSPSDYIFGKDPCSQRPVVRATP
jgi:hypothetical protein